MAEFSHPIVINSNFGPIFYRFRDRKTFSTMRTTGLLVANFVTGYFEIKHFVLLYYMY